MKVSYNLSKEDWDVLMGGLEAIESHSSEIEINDDIRVNLIKTEVSIIKDRLVDGVRK